MDNKSTSVNRDVRLLSPWFAGKVAKAVESCNELGYKIRVFEAWRSPERQDWLYAQGRTREGKIVTKARGWESWHQLGVAIDVAALDGKGKWTWDFPVDKVGAVFKKCGLESLAPFENAHYQDRGGMTLAQAKEIVTKQGMQALWIEIASKQKAANA